MFELKNMSDEELIREAKRLASVVFDSNAYHLSDAERLGNIADELKRRGYVIHLRTVLEISK